MAQTSVVSLEPPHTTLATNAGGRPQTPADGPDLSISAADPPEDGHTNTTPRLVAIGSNPSDPAFDRRCGHCENRRTVCANVREPSRMALFIPELLHALLHSADSGTLREARNRGRSIQIRRCPLEESNLPQPVKSRLLCR